MLVSNYISVIMAYIRNNHLYLSSMQKLILFICLLSVFACTSKKTLVNTNIKTKTEEETKKSEYKDSITINATNEKSKTSTENNTVVFEGVKFDSTGLISYVDKVTINHSKIQENKEKQSIVDTKVSTKDTLSIQRKELKKEEKEIIDKSEPKLLLWKVWCCIAGLLNIIVLLFYMKKKF